MSLFLSYITEIIYCFVVSFAQVNSVDILLMQLLRIFFFYLFFYFHLKWHRQVYNKHITDKLFAFIICGKIEIMGFGTIYIKALMVSKHNRVCNDYKNTSESYKTSQTHADSTQRAEEHMTFTL